MTGTMCRILKYALAAYAVITVAILLGGPIREYMFSQHGTHDKVNWTSSLNDTTLGRALLSLVHQKPLNATGPDIPSD